MKDEKRAHRGPDDATTISSGSETPSPLPSQTPATIADYTILGKLGEGGMGVVYEAEQRQPRRRVTLKVVRGGLFVDEDRVTPWTSG